MFVEKARPRRPMSGECAFLRLLSRVIFGSIGWCVGVRRQAAVQGIGYVYLLDGADT
ncbi:hypothetical protein AAH979_13415 [Plantactinospora sp. ZYX-F-223]|uniref:hypothetical protein n=1 Tax=Plantactinospora sp. ZYX-F-223 TaxID=3144103 RepID=UPI0031FDEF3F